MHMLVLKNIFLQTRTVSNTPFNLWEIHFLVNGKRKRIYLSVHTFFIVLSMLSKYVQESNIQHHISSHWDSWLNYILDMYSPTQKYVSSPFKYLRVLLHCNKVKTENHNWCYLFIYIHSRHIYIANNIIFLNISSIYMHIYISNWCKNSYRSCMKVG